MQNGLTSEHIIRMTDYSDQTVFRDESFDYHSLTEEEEIICSSIQLIDLSEAKKLFAQQTIELKIKTLRYILSHSLFSTEILQLGTKQSLETSYKDSLGSLCAMNEQGTKTIILESTIITRVLYISECLSSNEFLIIEHELQKVDKGYYVLTQVIKSRLSFHNKVAKEK